MAKILYISLTGMTEPLGESQVLQYLIPLAAKNNIILFSFEKPIDQATIASVKKRLADANIEWHYLPYSNRYGVFSSISQILSGFYKMHRIMKASSIEIIHARSLIPMLMGMLLRKRHRAKLLFDIRGFAIDEKIMDGRLKEHSLLTTFLKKIEGMSYRAADHLVTLTHASKKILNEQYRVPLDKMTVIPTCVNQRLFKPLSVEEKNAMRQSLGFNENETILLHNGAINGSIDFDGVVKLFTAISKREPAYRFVFLNKNQHTLVHEICEKYGLAKTCYQVYSCQFNEMYRYLGIADLCVFFIKPSFAKEASSPTKFAEGVACHRYSVTNKRFGDLTFYLENYPVGLLLEPSFVHEETSLAAEEVVTYLQNVSAGEKSQAVFDRLINEHFSHDIAIERYQHIYGEVR